MSEIQVSIPAVQKAQVTMTIVGDTSLITNCFSQKKQGDIRDKQARKPAKPKAPKDPEAEYQDSIYWTKDKKPGFPAGGIKKSAVSGCRFLDMAMTEARGAFFIIGDTADLIPIDGEPRMRTDPVRLLGKTTDMRYRAEFPEWSITLNVLYNPRIISVEGIANLLETAGFHIGIGDWRPEKNGTHGMFHVNRGE